MFYKLGKDTIKFLENFCHFLQIFLVFFAFFTVFYWLLKLANLTFVNFFSPIFEPVQNFTHIFYHRTLSTGDVTVDFSFLIASLFMLAIVWLLNFPIDFFQDASEKYEKLYSNFKKQQEKMMNKTLAKNSTNIEKENNKYLMMLSINVVNLMHDIKYDSNIDDEKDKKINEVMNTLTERIKEVLSCQFKAYDNSVMLYFDNFNTIDNVLTKVLHIISVVKTELANEKWKFSYNGCVEVYSKNSEVVNCTKNLFALNRLNLKNEIICLAAFNVRYELNKNKAFEVDGKGVYKMGENEVDVYVIKPQT